MSISMASRLGSTGEYVSKIPIVLHDPHACFFALFLWLQVRQLDNPSVASSKARFTLRVKLDKEFLYRFSLVEMHGSDIVKNFEE